MVKAKICAIISAIVILVLFSVFLFLMSIVDPDPIIIGHNETKSNSPRRADAGSGPYMDENFEDNFNLELPNPNSEYRYGLEKISEGDIISVNNTLKNETLLNHICNMPRRGSAINSFIANDPETTKTFRRSIDDTKVNTVSYNSGVILKIVDDTGRSRVEIKLGPKGNFEGTKRSSRSSQNKRSYNVSEILKDAEIFEADKEVFDADKVIIIKILPDNVFVFDNEVKDVDINSSKEEVSSRVKRLNDNVEDSENNNEDPNELRVTINPENNKNENHDIRITDMYILFTDDDIMAIKNSENINSSNVTKKTDNDLGNESTTTSTTTTKTEMYREWDSKSPIKFNLENTKDLIMTKSDEFSDELKTNIATEKCNELGTRSLDENNSENFKDIKINKSIEPSDELTTNVATQKYDDLSTRSFDELSSENKKNVTTKIDLQDSTTEALTISRKDIK